MPELSVEELLAEVEGSTTGKPAGTAVAPPPAPPAGLPRWWLLAALAGLWLLWSTPVVYPLKLLVVFFHELSHGLAAIVTGGRIVGIELVPQEGGLCRTAGGSRFLVLSAGYLGSLVWGGVILLLAAKSRQDRKITLALGLVLLGTAVLWVRPMISFAMAFALLAGAALVGASRLLSPGVNDFLLRLVGLTSLFYAVFDIQDDILRRPHLTESDAAQLAALTGIPTLVWGVIWMGLALGAGGWFLRRAWQTRA
jgi:hypothetical protein